MDVPARQPTRMSPTTRIVFRVLGPLFLVAGAALFAGLFLFNPLPSDPAADGSHWFATGAASMFGSFILFAIGGALTRFGYMGALSGVVATETAPAVEYGSTAMGRGIGDGLKQSGVLGSVGTQQVVKVKCRSCGFLETEDAAFCSKCGKKM